MRTWLKLVAGVVSGVLVPVGWPEAAQEGAATSGPARPDIVLIVTDDEDLALHASMPKVKALIEDQGASFSNYFVTYSFCCPSRATILRGQYPHNHNIEGNVWPTGGFEKFRALGHESSTIATWLDAAGYHTAIIGKYLNGYVASTHEPAPGWDDWAIADNAYFNFALNRNGRIVQHGEQPEDYLTDVLAREAVGIIRHAAGSAQPLFLLITPYSPHTPTIPAPRHAHLFADAPLPRPPSFDEADTSDKPAPVRDLPRIGPEQVRGLEQRHRQRLRTMQAVDDLVEAVVQALDQTGRLARTYIVYTSDNGLHMGEHRIRLSKTTPYEETIRVPLLVRGPSVPAGSQVEQMVLNNDLAPTLAALAGVEPPAFVDGRSFLPLLDGEAVPWRQSFLIERRETEKHVLTGAAVFDAIRTQDWLYVEYGNGEREFYDLEADPFQLDNRVASTDAPLEALADRLAELKNRAAVNCRELEDQPIGRPPAVALPAPFAEPPLP
jgi:arylsulfatase A-like enzyme